MQEYLNAINRTKELAPQARRQRLLPMMTNSVISQSFNYIFAGKNARELMRGLVDASADRDKAEIIAHYIDINSDKFADVMKSDDAKLKKSCAQLLGKLRPNEYAALLMDSLTSENTEFVKPSIILALGNADKTAGVQEFLENYQITATEDKHIEEQRNALDKAISSLKAPKTEVKMIASLKKGTSLILKCPSVRVTQREVTKLKYAAQVIDEKSNLLKVDGVERYRRIFAARSFYKAFILFDEFFNPAAAVNAAASDEFLSFVRALYGEGELTYRLDITADVSRDDRKKLAEELSKKIREKGFVNSPSSYAFEIAVFSSERRVYLCVLPQPQLDDRFIYKKKSISASIHPAAAAACVSFIAPFTKKNAAVLDCFCGSGTMLFERARLPYGSLMGTDISKEALNAARLNEKFAKTGAHFYLKNALADFQESFDEVICNLPFGLRVGSHMKNEELYRKFLVNLKKLLKKGGYAFLFTHDKRLLSGLIEKSGMELVSKHTFSCGGLYPSMFIIKNK